MEISKKMKKVINIISIIIWMAVIFTFSAMSGEESNQKSKEAIKETVNTIKNLAVYSNSLDMNKERNVYK